MDDQDWRLRAACRGLDIEVFYSTDEAEVQRALDICDGCPVREPCLDVAMGQRESFGVWGGTAEASRRRVFRRERRRPAA